MSKQSFYFYDLETSGVNARSSRIMQFAGRRVDMDLKPIGEPHNILIKLSDDVLAEPDAIMVTGITPQKTWADGISEAEFCKIFFAEIMTPGTIFTGFNSVRFDDEFMRFMFWRNFCDPYEWQWKDGRSRWDLLDVSRMTRALRPDGIKWPFAPDGKPTNRLEMLASINGLDHDHAHDALSDVDATIGLARLIKQKQPKLFDYLLSMRDKHQVKKLIETRQPFVYSSGKYSGEFEKTTVAQTLGPHPDRQGVFVYDLRHEPGPFIDMSPEQLAEAWKYTKDPDVLRLPVKVLQFNRCPAVAPLGVLDDDAQQRLKLDLDNLTKNRTKLLASSNFVNNLKEAVKILNLQREQSELFVDEKAVDAQLYDGFVGDGDKVKQAELVEAKLEDISSYKGQFKDDRLNALVDLYKARNYTNLLTDEERSGWDAHRRNTLLKSAPRFVERLNALSEQYKSDQQKQYLLEELSLYFESVIPEEI